MPERKARSKLSPRHRRRPPSEWDVLGRYLKQMTGHDLDRYAHLVAVLKERFGRLDDREIWTGYALRRAASAWRCTVAATIRPTRIRPEAMAPITSSAKS
jgi:hypothetical protein